jgi:Cys-rich repeat protein
VPGTGQHVCVQCNASTDCKTGNYCDLGQCVPDTCTPGTQSCNGRNIETCNNDGSGTTATGQCFAPATCIDDGAGKASCGTPTTNPTTDAGSCDLTKCTGNNPCCATGGGCGNQVRYQGGTYCFPTPATCTRNDLSQCTGTQNCCTGTGRCGTNTTFNNQTICVPG